MENKVTILDQSFDFGPKIQFYNFVFSKIFKKIFQSSLNIYWFVKEKVLQDFSRAFRGLIKSKFRTLCYKGQKETVQFLLGLTWGIFSPCCKLSGSICSDFANSRSALLKWAPLKIKNTLNIKTALLCKKFHQNNFGKTFLLFSKEREKSRSIKNY